MNTGRFKDISYDPYKKTFIVANFRQYKTIRNIVQWNKIERVYCLVRGDIMVFEAQFPEIGH